MIEKILSQLDEDQFAAVTAPMNKPICVRANAGSGKTRVLSSRVGYLVSKNVPGILLLTFTNKAAKEMLERVNKLVGKDADIKIMSGTFHHIACIFLRKYSTLLNIKSNFTILIQSDALAIMQRCRTNILNDIAKKDIPKDFLGANKILSKYSYFRNTAKNISFNDFLRNQHFYPIEVELLEKIISEYEKFKKESNSMDFDDLIINFKYILQKYPKVCKSINRSYPYILADEYQDVNYIQKEIIDLLDCDINPCQFVVGDEAQSIYGFRGSNIHYILEFKENHRNAIVYTLRFNYRSGAGIVKLAENAINIKVEKEEEKKVMLPYNCDKIIPVIKGFVDDMEQSESVADMIISNRYEWGETAILVRNNFIMRNFEFELKKRKIKYKLIGGMPFYERAHIKDIISFLIFESNLDNKIAFSRILTLIKGVGPKTANNIYDELKKINFNFDLSATIKLPKKTREDLIYLFEIINQLKIIDKPSDKLMFIHTNLYNEYLEKQKEDEKSLVNKQKDIEFLIKNSRFYKNTENFLQDLMLENNDSDDSKNEVIISTIHRSKGLEWDNVFLPYLNKDIFPSGKSDTDAAIEEELRLFYVAITRAKKNLLISYINAYSDDPGQNILYGSPFLQRLDNSLFENK